MKEKELHSYGLPRSIQYMSGTIFVVLAVYALMESGLSGLPRILVWIGLITAGIFLTLKGTVELFTFVFTSSAPRLGRWYGRRVARLRQSERK